MLTDLGAAFAELRDDATTRVVIVTGAPPVFSAGADAGHAKAATPEERRRLFLSRKSQFRRLFERSNALLENLEQATIAAVNGHAVGGGWGLALACDFRIAAAEAQFWIPEVDLGVPLGVGTTTRFVRMVGPARAKEIIMGCARYSAADAQALGPRESGGAGGRAGAGRARLRAAPGQEAGPAARRGQGPHQRDRAHRHPRGQRDDRGVPRPRVSAAAHRADQATSGRNCSISSRPSGVRP